MLLPINENLMAYQMLFTMKISETIISHLLFVTIIEKPIFQLVFLLKREHFILQQIFFQNVDVKYQ